MSGTVGGSTYVLTFQSQSVVQGMAQTQQQIAQSSAAIVAALSQITQGLNTVTNTAAATGGALGGGGGVRGAITSAVGGAGGMVSSLATLTTGLGAATLALRSIREALNFVADGVIGFNDKLAKSHITWEVFTGDAAAADAQVQALFKFSRETPFTFEQVDNAARQLAAFGGVAFASAENLTLLGDIAAGTNKPLQTITYEFGQMYKEIENGQPFGRAARALVMFGALSAETRTQLESMKASGASTSEMLEVFTNNLERFDGLVKKQATETLSGAMTTLTDTVQSLIAIGGKGLFDELIGGVTGLNKAAESDTALVWAKNIGVAIRELVLDLSIIINSVKLYFEMWLGAWQVFLITVGTGIAKLLDWMGNIVPGMKSIADGMNESIRQIKQDLIGTASNFDNTANDIIKALAAENKWAEGGQKAAGAWTGGFKAKASGASDDLDAIAREYVAAITQGFSTLDLKEMKGFDTLSGFVETLLLGSGKDPEAIMQDIKPQILSAIMGLHDDVNMGLFELKQVLPPEVYAQVEKYVEALREADQATVALGIATRQLNAAEEAYNKTLADSKEAHERTTAAVKQAEAARDSNAASFNNQVTKQNTALADLRLQAEGDAEILQGNIRAAQDALNSLQESVAQHARDGAARIAEQQRAITALQAEIDQNARAGAARIEEQQKIVTEKQNLQTEHEQAFAAILRGETERFLEQKGAIDATTQAILDRYNAEIEGKLRAAAGDDQRVTRLEREERAKLLELDTRIRQLRAQGHFKEAEQLQEQRNKVAASYDDQIKYASQVAAVSKDKADEAKERIEKEAQASGDKDKKEVDGAKTTLDGIKDEVAARAEADRLRMVAQQEILAGIQEDVKAQAEADRLAMVAAKAAVDQAQEAARLSAEDYKQRERDIQKNILDIKAQAAEQKIRDDLAVTAAITIKGHIDKIWDKAVADAKLALDHAKDIVTAAKDHKTAADLELTTMVALTKEWEKQYNYALGILNAERQRRDLDPVKVIPTTPQPKPGEEPIPSTPVSMPPAGSTPPGSPRALPPGTAPPGFVADPPPSASPPTKPGGFFGSDPPPPAPAAPASAPPSRSNPHFIAPTVPGFSPTAERPYPDGTWWDPKNGFVPDGYEVRDGDVLYWIGISNSYMPPTGGPGERSMIAAPLSAMLAGQTPGLLRSPVASAGMFGVTNPAAGGASQGGFSGSVKILEGAFANTTIDSPERLEEARWKIVAGVRQALNDHVSVGEGSRIGRKL